MRASASAASRESNRIPVIDPSVERAVQAAQLLREALALLNVPPETAVLPAAKSAPDRLLRLPEVERLTGLRRSAIYEQMQRGVFPRSFKTGLRAAAWSETAVQAWIAERIEGAAGLSSGSGQSAVKC
jgi:prophage regulatory protein